MRYIVAMKEIDGTVGLFSTRWFEPANHWTIQILFVIDCYRHLVMRDGDTWETIEEDNL
jgi:hypothetical protein